MPGHRIILYDGVCGLCNRLVRFVLKHDRQDRFCFAALQSGLAKRVLERHAVRAGNLDTAYLVLNYGEPGEQLMARSDVAIHVLRDLGGTWARMASLLQLFPERVRNLLYDFIARSRYRVFGKYQSCPVPDPEVRAKFLDLSGS